MSGVEFCEVLLWNVRVHRYYVLIITTSTMFFQVFSVVLLQKV